MDILESIEMRWFLPADDGDEDALTAWFRDVPAESSRVDGYLLTGREDLGFKGRRAAGQRVKVETKYLVGSLGVIPIATGVVGVLERWRKLSLDIDDDALSQRGTWLEVAKERRLRKLAFTDQGVMEVKASAKPACGAGLELTTLRYSVGDRALSSLTLGIEAFGPEEQLLTIFQETARSAFAGCPAQNLGATRSMGYPAWLARLVLS